MYLGRTQGEHIMHMYNAWILYNLEKDARECVELQEEDERLAEGFVRWLIAEFPSLILGCVMSPKADAEMLEAANSVPKQPKFKPESELAN